MLSSVLNPASWYWRFPFFAAPADGEGALTGTVRSECIDWPPRPPLPGPSSQLSPGGHDPHDARPREIREVLATTDLYHILGVPHTPGPTLDRLTLRRAYLSRSRACHPDKCPGNPDATDAFQRISIAYGVLSQPSLKRMYDARGPTDADSSDWLRAPPCAGYADETLQGVLLGIVSDYLDGNLEMIRTLLHAISDLNPSLKLGDEGIEAVLSVLENLRGRILACRACVLALHTELVRVLEIQYAFRQLPYLDIAGRSRLTIQLTRITLRLPVTLEKAIQGVREDATRSADSCDAPSSVADEDDSSNDPGCGERDGDGAAGALLPRRVVLLIRGIDVILDRMERVLT